MTAMIERVARATFDVIHADTPETFRNEMWADLRNTAMDVARAAIEAMREPTSAMAAAGSQPRYIGREVWPQPMSGPDAYRAMIEAALAESPPR